MRNPARRLHEIFTTSAESYNDQTTAMTARGLEGKNDEAYGIQLEVFRLVIAIDQALTYLESRSIDMEIYRHEWKNWIDIVLHLPNNWTGSSSSNSGFPETSMAHLHTLEILLDVDRPSLSAEPEQTLRMVLKRVFELLSEDEAISDSLRSYIYRLADEMRTAMDDESIVGTFDFADAAERLWVGLQAAAGQSRSNKKAWKETGQVPGSGVARCPSVLLG